MQPVTLGPKIDGARHGMCDAGPVVMDQAGKDACGYLARLTVGGRSFQVWWGSLEGDEYGWEWFSWIELDGRQWLVTIDPDTWVVRFGDCVQRRPWVDPSGETP